MERKPGAITFSEITKDIERNLNKDLVGMMLVGSSSWSNTENCRDVDIDIVLHKFDLLKSIDLKELKNRKLADTFEVFIEEHLTKVLATDISMFSLKYFEDNKEISIRFSKKKLFDYVCSLDLKNTKNTISVVHFRTNETKPFDNQKNFWGEKISYKCWNFESDSGFLIEAPIIIVDELGKFYPGQIVDRFISFPEVILQKKNYCSGNLGKLFVNVVKRLAFEQERNPYELLHVDNCLCRSDRISEERRMSMRYREESILRQLVK